MLRLITGLFPFKDRFYKRGWGWERIGMFVRFSYVCLMKVLCYLLFLSPRTACFSSFELHPTGENRPWILLMHTIKLPWKNLIDLLIKSLRTSHILAFTWNSHVLDISVSTWAIPLNPGSCKASPAVLGDTTYFVHVPELVEKDLFMNPTLKINKSVSFPFFFFSPKRKCQEVSWSNNGACCLHSTI